MSVLQHHFAGVCHKKSDGTPNYYWLLAFFADVFMPLCLSVSAFHKILLSPTFTIFALFEGFHI